MESGAGATIVGRAVVEVETDSIRSFSWEWWTDYYATHYRRCILKGEDPNTELWTTYIREADDNELHLVHPRVADDHTPDEGGKVRVYLFNDDWEHYRGKDKAPVSFAFQLDRTAEIRAERLEIIARALKHLEETPRDELLKQLAGSDLLSDQAKTDPEMLAENFRAAHNAATGADDTWEWARLFGIWKTAQRVLLAAGLPYN